MASPHKVIIFYNFNQSKQHNDTFTNLDRIVKLGCSGRIILEDLNQDLSRVNDIKQLLGMSGYTSSEEMRQCIKDRFGKMKLGILSTCSQIISMGTEAGFKISYLIKPDTTLESLQSYIQQLLKEDQVDCLFIDLTVEEDKDNNNNFLSSWKWMDTLMKEWVDASTILKCIVTKCTNNNSNNNNNSDQQQQQNDSSKNNNKKLAKYYLDDIIPPPQSYEYKNGIRVKIIKDVSYVCAYYHTETTRADLVEKFNVKDMEKLGCNGSILSWHYLAEIGNKLGYVPKYGA